MSTHIHRRIGVPQALREQLKVRRRERGWTQQELGRRVGLPQMHISGIETGKVVPRFDTLLEIVRTLGDDLLLVPRTLVPAVQGLVREAGTSQHCAAQEEEDEYLYPSSIAEEALDEEQSRSR